MNNRSQRDLLFIVYAAILATVVEYTTGIFGYFLLLIERLENWLLTELFIILMVGTFGFGIYAWRRWQELAQTRAEILELQESVTEFEGLNQRYRDYAEAVTHGQEEERQRLARELHDDTIHSLILLNQKIELILFDHADNPIAADVAKMQTLLTNTINSIRRFIQELRPTYLDEIGLIPALQKLVDEKTERTGINFNFERVGHEQRLTTKTELTLFRISQTALRNVFLHSEADWARVTLTYAAQAITLEIEDNGIGFDVPDLSELAERGSFGLVGMMERAAQHQGTFKINSELGKGTVINIQIPIDSEHHESL